jgi:type III restriction enzyme
VFDKVVDLTDLNILRNLSEPGMPGAIINTFRHQINDLTVLDKGEATVRNHISLRKTRSCMVTHQEATEPKRSVFNKVVGDSHFELEVARALDTMEGVVSFAKNYFATNFKMEYQNADGDISYYYPDFIVKLKNDDVYIIETKGREDLDDMKKIKRLEQWCEDVNASQTEQTFHMLYVMQEEWDRLRQEPKTFEERVSIGKNESGHGGFGEIKKAA